MNEGDGTLHVEVMGRKLTAKTTPELGNIERLPRSTSLQEKVEKIERLKVCVGNQDPKLLQLADKTGTFYNARQQAMAKVEHGTIRHFKCAMLLNEGTRCSVCSKQRKSLLVKLKRDEAKRDADGEISRSIAIQTE